jgi:hypothetical protein
MCRFAADVEYPNRANSTPNPAAWAASGPLQPPSDRFDMNPPVSELLKTEASNETLRLCEHAAPQPATLNSSKACRYRLTPHNRRFYIKIVMEKSS